MPDQIIYTLLENNPEFNTQGGSDTDKKKLNRSRFDKGAIRIAGHFVPTKPKGYVVDSDYIRDCYTGKPLSDTIEDVQEAAVASQEQLNSMLEDGKIKSDYLPSYVDDVINGYYDGLNFYDLDHNPVVGEEGKIYLDVSTKISYRYDDYAESYIPVGAATFSGLEVEATFTISVDTTDPYNPVYTVTCDKTPSELSNSPLINIVCDDFSYNLKIVAQRNGNSLAAVIGSAGSSTTLLFVYNSGWSVVIKESAVAVSGSYNDLTDKPTVRQEFVIDVTDNTINKTYSEILTAINNNNIIILNDTRNNYTVVCTHKINNLNSIYLEGYIHGFGGNNGITVAGSMLTVHVNEDSTYLIKRVNLGLINKDIATAFGIKYVTSQDLADLISSSTLLTEILYRNTTDGKFLLATSSNTLVEIQTTSYTPQP